MPESLGVVGDKEPLSHIHEPRQLCEVHGVHVKKVAATRKASHQSVHVCNWPSVMIMLIKMSTKKVEEEAFTNDPWDRDK